MILRLRVQTLTKENAQQFETAATAVPDVTGVDSWNGRAEINLNSDSAVPAVVAALRTAGFEVELPGTPAAKNDPAPSPGKEEVRQVAIDGMTCRSCEINIERKFRKVPGVCSVSADAGRGTARIVCSEDCVPSVEQLQSAIKGHGYTVRGFGSPDRTIPGERPSFWTLIGLFAFVLLLGSLLSKLGLGGGQVDVGGSMTLAAALVLGLVAGSSSCLAVSGGLLLSSAAKFRERYGNASIGKRMKPVFLFVAGRTISYGIFGGVIGALGQAFTPSPLVTGGLMLLAAAYMLIMGLDMLKIAPPWLKGFLPRMPKRLSHAIMDKEKKEHPAAPFLLGAGTFFLPCGFTQSLQLYALTTGSFLTSGLLLGAFALGTAPALLALGWASSSLKGKFGTFFFRFSGALVIVLGLWNIQNGLTVAGYPISLPWPGSGTVAVAGEERPAAVLGEKQVIKMAVGGDRAPYAPDTFTVKAGVPVRWEITGVDVRGCISYLQATKLGVGLQLRKGPNVVEFTPKKPGRYTFSCSMGMFRGTINVI